MALVAALTWRVPVPLRIVVLAGKPGEAPEEPPHTGPTEVRWLGEDDDDEPSGRDGRPPGEPISWKERRLGRHSP